MFKTRLLIISLVCFGSMAGGCSKSSFSYPVTGVSELKLIDTVTYLTELRPARNYSNIRSLNKAGAYIACRFKEYGLEPAEQNFNIGGKEYKNIIACAGKDTGDGIIVIGAHYDVCGDQPGADDNASAVAGLLEIARFAKRFEKDLPCKVEFVAYSLEEPPFFGTGQMGSYVHAKSLHDKGVKVKGMISLEMIGYFTNKKNSQRFPIGVMGLFYPNKGNFIGVASNYESDGLKKHFALHMKAADIDVRALSAPSYLKGVDFSDHRNYWKFGFDAVMITDTSFYRNPNYHKKTDTIETLSFSKIKEVVNGVCWALLNF